MKKILIALSICVSGIMSPAQSTSELTVIIKDLKNINGQVLIALFDNPEGFPAGDQTSFSTQKLGIPKTGVTACFKDLQSGFYAVSFVHDENSNDAMDKNGFGIPKETYGISNNIKMGFGPPKFEEAKFYLSENDTTITIRPSN